MYSNTQKLSSEDVQALRREAGQELKALRQAQGLSQSEIARMVEIQQFTFVSQLETGRARVPPDKYVVWAKALDVDPRDFVQMLMRYYDPVTYDILFGSPEPSEAEPIPAKSRAARVV